MAAMSTVLTEFSTYGDSRTYTTSGHTASKPKLVLQKRKVPGVNGVVQESTISVVQATTDVDGIILAQKVTMSVTVRSPLLGDAADVAAALVILRDIVAGDEFENAVSTQEYLA